ncbi:Cellular retinoic acid binding protein 2, b [Branchiostoma belcheri]|nr:Cellular retinoic acid binding protein 2, b [Branchiostoma belcheri]
MEKDAAQIAGSWRQDHSQNENYEDLLRAYGLSWFPRKMAALFKVSAIEEYTFNGDQMTYRSHSAPPTQWTLTLGQPTNVFVNGVGLLQMSLEKDEYGRYLTRVKKGDDEMIHTHRIDSKGQLEISTLLPSGKTSRRVLKRL